MPHLKSIFAAAAIATAAMIGSASAMPAANLGTTAAQTVPGIQSGLQNVRWVCGPYRCFWRPGPVWWRRGPVWWGRPGWRWRRRFYWHRRW